MGTDYEYLDKGNDDGTIFGYDSDAKISFYGVAPTAQQSHITAVATTAATTATPYGYTTSTQADAIVTAINAICVALETIGIVADA